MINKDRIIPIQKTSFLDIVALILAIAGVVFAILEAATIDGVFEVAGTGDAGNKLANQPVRSLDFKSGVTAAVVYFVADYNFEGFKVAGEDATMGSSSEAVNPDGVTLYKATLSSGEVTVEAVAPSIA